MNRIKELREEKRITQLRLSIKLEVSQETISAYEMGKHYPSVKSLLKLRDIFGVSIDYILGLTDIKNPLNETYSFSADTLNFLNIYEQLDNIGKEKVKSYVEGYIDSNSI